MTSEAAAVKEAHRGLTWKALMTSVSALLQSAAGFLVGLLVTPVVVRGLGQEFYGVWAIIQQATRNVALTDFNPSGMLKQTLAAQQHDIDLERKRRLIGAGLVVWAFALPLFLGITIWAVWAVPTYIRTSPSNVPAARLALGISLVGLFIGRLLSLPGNVLRGMNLEYKSMGLNAATIFIGGSLAAAAIWLGYGLVGVALAGAISVAATGVVRMLVARRCIPWLGVAAPRRVELLEFGRNCGWATVSGVGLQLLVGSELLLVGYLFSPTTVTVYAMTGIALRMTSGFVQQLIMSTNPGMASLCGLCQWERVHALRIEMHRLGLAVAAVFGICVLLLNRSFLVLWLGEGYYGGMGLLLVLLAGVVIGVLTWIDIGIMNCMLDFRSLARSFIVSGLCAVVTGLLLARFWGPAGIAAGVVAGQSTLLLLLGQRLAHHIQATPRAYLRSVARQVAAVFLLCAGGAMLSTSVSPGGWPSFVAYATATVALAAAVVWRFGLQPDVRAHLNRRYATVLGAGLRSTRS